MSIETIEKQLQRFKPDVSIPAEMKQAYASLADTRGFDRHFSNLLAAETAGDYKNPDHHKRTRDDKAYFHAKESRLSSELLGLVFPTIGRIGDSGPMGAYDETKVIQAVEAIDRDGCYIWPELVDPAICDRFVETLGEQTFYARGTNEIVQGYDPAKAESYDANSIWVQDQSKLIVQPDFQALAFDPMLLDVAQRYLSCCPVHTQVNSWWSINARNDRKSLSTSAQMFHQDKDFVRFLKAFLYLTDVEEDTGAHVYVAGSHKDYQQRFDSAEPFSKRFDDAEIADVFGAERVRPLVGKRGTLLFADTSGFHKGAPVMRGHRLLVQLEWTCSLFLTPMQPTADEALPESSKALREQHPRLFANYDAAARHSWEEADAKGGKAKGVIGRLSNSIKKRLKI